LASPPWKRRPVCKQAIAVVPLPRNGSATRSRSSVVERITRETSAGESAFVVPQQATAAFLRQVGPHVDGIDPATPAARHLLGPVEGTQRRIERAAGQQRDGVVLVDEPARQVQAEPAGTVIELT
jgi:hypothetical protein